MKVLLIGEEIHYVSKFEFASAKGKFKFELASSIEEALNAIISFFYDVVVVDTKKIGTEEANLISLIKESDPLSSIIIIAAASTLEDKLAAFNLGADDHLTKPFETPELLARILALHRRTKLSGRQIIEIGALRINTESQLVFVANESLPLTPREYDLLLFFVTNKNRVLSKAIIAENIWGSYTESLDEYDFIYQHVKNLRKKLKGQGDYIKNVYGRGYRFTVI